MKKLFLFILPILTIINFSLNAQECKRVNLLYKKWGMFPRQMPLYDQGENGICYAYSAAQMVDYWRETYGLRIRKIKMGQSSPVFAAILGRLYKKSLNNQSSLDGGNIRFALEGIRDFGMCTQNIVEESIQRFASEKEVDSGKFLHIIERFFSKHRKDSQKSKIMRIFQTPFEKLRRAMFHEGIDFEKIEDIMKPYLEKNDFVGFMRDVFRDCFKEENIYRDSRRVPKTKNYRVSRNIKSAVEKVNSLLDTKDRPQPVGLGYCANILLEKDYQGLVHGGFRARPKEDCHGHASIIVGKRTRENRCQFLVRNTWGTECDYDWECLTDNEGQSHGIWVDAVSLMKNTVDLYYLDPEGSKKMTLWDFAKKDKKKKESKIRSFFKKLGF